MLGRDDQIAGQSDLEAAAERKPVYGSNYRLIQIEAPGQPGKAAGRVLVLAQLRANLQIGAGTEAALSRAANDRDPQISIVRERVKYLCQFKVGRWMQRVKHLGPVEGNMQYSPLNSQHRITRAPCQFPDVRLQFESLCSA